MHIWKFEYKGLYLGGIALVIADSEATARKLLLESCHAGWNQEHWGNQIIGAKCSLIPFPTAGGVIYDDDGDY